MICPLLKVLQSPTLRVPRITWFPLEIRPIWHLPRPSISIDPSAPLRGPGIRWGSQQYPAAHAARNGMHQWITAGVRGVDHQPSYVKMLEQESMERSS